MKRTYKAKQRACATCKFWERSGQFSEIGWCNRYPPSPREQDVGTSPMTHQEFWCGEYKPNELLERRGVK